MAGGNDPRAWPDKALGVCLSLLAGAIALYAAVRLIEAIWWVLLIIVGSGLAVTGLVAVWRYRFRGW